LDKGIDLNFQAVMYDENIDIVKSLLLYAIVNTSLENFRGKTPLDMAIQSRRDGSAKLIEEYDETRNKALIANKVDDFGYNALHVAAKEGCSIELFHRILGLIHNVNAVNYE
jgi:ankyrin repeat protein